MTPEIAAPSADNPAGPEAIAHASPAGSGTPAAPAVLRWYADPWCWLIVALAAFFLLYQLGQRPFWQDEAETACLAKNVLKYGLPRVTDGVSVISQEQGREYGPDLIWSWSPWMQIYVSALGLKLGGLNTFAGRFPFALAGVICVLLTYRMVRVHFNNIQLARLAALFLTLTVPFLLFGRQNRYYTLGTILTILSMEAFLPKRPKGWACVLAGISMGLMFHANYLLLFSFGPAAMVARCLVDRQLPRLKELLLMGVCALVIILPGFMLYGIGKQGGMMDMTKIPANIGNYFADFVQFILPLPVAAYLVWRWRKFFLACMLRHAPQEYLERSVLMMALIMLGSVLILALIPQQFLRYLVHLYPLLAVILAWVCLKALKAHTVCGVLLTGLLLFTNWMHIIPMEVLGIVNRPWQSDPRMLTYPNLPIHLLLTELVRGYPDVNSGIVNFFREHARKNDTILISYGDLPLQFYTDFKILGGLRADDPDALDNPEWLVKRSVSRTDRDGFLVQSDDAILHMLNLERDYDRLDVDIADDMFGNRADPYYHQFVPQEEPYQKLVVYRRKDLRDRQ
ncbi:ArnT family glycosyltransferase [Megalodesulfovibrio paquesii]